MSTLRLHFFATLVLVLAACQQGQPPAPTPTPDFEFQVAEALSLVQGQQQTLELTLTRKHGHSEAIQWSLEAAEGNTLPSGLSASFSPNPSPANTEQLSLRAAASLAAQDYALRLRARAGTLEKTRPLHLTVQQAHANPPTPGLALSLDNPSPSVTQGNRITLALTLNRTNLTQPITLSVVQPNGSALPSGLEASFDPNPASANSSALRLNVATSVTAQSYALQVRGVAGGVNASLNFSLEVRPAPVSQTVTLTTRRKETGQLENARFVAFQNGDAAWQTLIGSNGTYSATVTNSEGRYGVIAVCSQPDFGFSMAYVQSAHLTTQETTRLELCEGAPQPARDDFAGVTGRAFGLTPDDPGFSISSWNAEQLSPGEAPRYDLLAFRGVINVYAVRRPSAARSPNGQMATRGFFIRDIDLNATPYVNRDVDFLGPQAFDLAGPFTVNVTNAALGATYSLELAFQGTILGRNGNGSHSMSYRAIPDHQIRSGEFHIMMIRGDSNQLIVRTFATASNLSIAAPPRFTPTTTHNSGLPRVAWTQANQGIYIFTYRQNTNTPNGNSLATDWRALVSRGWLQSNQNYTLPNLNGLGGWQSEWNFNPTSPISASLLAINYNNPPTRLLTYSEHYNYGPFIPNMAYDETVVRTTINP
ncbi:MAG: hypothetical protein SFU83_21825 [Meiothermus sp.]|nr:hypothetical protein [Meiothermus sp.]